MRENTCYFSGHRRLPREQIGQILLRLEKKIIRLSGEGIVTFLSGGALGFDQLAAKAGIDMRRKGLPIRLGFALPCWNQDVNWREDERRIYRNLLMQADFIHYVGERYAPGCMKARNQYLVDHAGVCLCALLHGRSGTAQTVRMAKEAGLRIINVAGQEMC